MEEFMSPASAPDKAEVGQRLNVLRRALGYTQQNKMAAFLGDRITITQWNNWELGKHLPHIANARYIAMKCRVTTDWILFGDRAGLTLGMAERLDEIERRDRQDRGDSANRA
jgi:transcriptional regulator with XRE-family HTH domain